MYPRLTAMEVMESHTTSSANRYDYGPGSEWHSLMSSDSSIYLIQKERQSVIQPISLPVETPKRGWSFWLCFLSIAISSFISALELTVISTALPVIVNDLHGTEFVWVGSAYAMAATAFLPLSGALAQAFGRRPVMLSLLLIFALGSALCGAATSLNFLIAGRTVQGLAGGGIASLTQIILSDLVPLRERGTFNGLIAMAWGVATCTGPVVGGALSQRGQWRWLFYMNIPICAFAASLVFVFLRLRRPEGTLREKLGRMDWLGNCLVISSTVASVIGLTWGGIQFSWGSPQVLVPLILGLVGLGVFLVYEANYPKHAIVPFYLMSTITGLSGYLQTFVTPVVLLAVVYYGPVYWQACKGASPTASGVDGFGLAYTTVPVAIIAGLSVVKTNRYRPQLWFAWALLITGTGLMTTLTADSTRWAAIGYQIVVGAGIGILFTTTYFPVLAPLPVTANAQALAFFAFLRYFAQVWGVTIGGTILQNGLRARLPAQFAATFPEGTAIAYAVIPLIDGLAEPLQTEVRVAFADSLQVVWRVLVGISGLGLLVSLPMKHLPLHTSVDKNWGLEEASMAHMETQEIGLLSSKGAPFDSA